MYMEINIINLKKYMLQFVSLVSSYILSPCKIKGSFAMSLGFISSTIFVLLDNQYPYVVIEKDNSNQCSHY